MADKQLINTSLNNNNLTIPRDGDLRFLYPLQTDYDRGLIKAFKSCEVAFCDTINNLEKSGGSKELSLAKVKMGEAVALAIKHITKT